ncbi:MAG: hypothetical protein ACTSR8_04660 [Promethearchaeota archaeon]
MLDQLEQKINSILNKFTNFSNYIELADFRSYILFTLNGTVPANILAQFGFGGAKDIINIPYNPISKTYFQKVSLMTSNSLIIYVKSEPITEKFLIEKDDPILKEYLDQNEMDLAFRGKEKFLIPQLSDCTNFSENSKLKIKIDDLFHSLESFLAFTEPNILFVIDADSDSEPDIIFAFNITPEIPTAIDFNFVKIDVFLDDKHLMKDITYIKREEDYKIQYLKEIKNISHSEVFKSKFALVLHIKSFNNPYK